jgi:hypothetical protein
VAPLDGHLELADEASGARLEIGRDLDASGRDLVVLSPEDAGGIEGLAARARTMARSDFGMGTM